MFSGLSRNLKKILPKQLFYRSLIIVAAPIIIMQITISAPPPTGISVEPMGNSMSLSWDKSTYCSNITGYKIYRKDDRIII